MQKPRLYNTLTKTIEEFNPIHEGMVSMYHCGPTVYDYLHIGNMRTYVFADTLRRLFTHLGYTVNQVINITDVGHLVGDGDEGEDKLEKGSRTHGKTAKEVANFFTDIFYKDLAELNILTTGTQFPKATEYIQEQIALIQELEKRGHTYTTSDGVYFDVDTWKEYGKLGQIDLEGLEAGKRIAHIAEKHTAYDFALWKFSPTDGSVRQQEWESPWGKGFPGWHIECSAMSMKLLGETFDIHTGGIDHIPVHHNNEIAQSESVTGKPLAHLWMHGAFLNWKDKKMSKSDGSFITLENLKERGIPALAFRYLLLQSKYRQPIVFDIKSLEASHTAYGRLLSRIYAIYHELPVDAPSNHTQLNNLLRPIEDAMLDDLNTAKALAQVWTQVTDNIHWFAPISRADFTAYIKAVDTLLGLNLGLVVAHIDIPKHVQKKITERDHAKKEKDFEKADKLRIEIRELGYEVLDSKDGTQVMKK